MAFPLLRHVAALVFLLANNPLPAPIFLARQRTFKASRRVNALALVGDETL